MKATKIKSTKTIDFYSVDTTTVIKIPMVSGKISAGFPSPADDYLDITIDLNKELIKNPSSTFLGRVKGLSMKDAGISDGDVLVVDKSLEPGNNKIAVCFINGEFTLKKIKIEKKEVFLMPANENFKPLKITEENDFMIWGIVTYVIKKI
ncbi:MAG: translesion error-prone DNA polymerase V autoproteolytic subunit [Bacteroidales bacterium]|nr:translesion error-prone DNA polymerase V autoproteolytic subunit [Bacteroidales bacterium]